MCSITFLGQRQNGGTLERTQVRFRGGRRCTLLELIEQHGLHHRCACRNGTCGSCAVKVAVLRHKGQHPGVYLGNPERETLFAAGRLTRQQYASPVLACSSPIWRLACQYLVGEEDIVVAL
ncbi:2Fe-2S iron-sulfur cluster-binding protein [Methylocaldum sp.]|uniref:2Fe-2S iron-sulfur cluster-binding protein n=1 Tax=Methylocaldum sp. TaxID=1969727 RepID=UPI002D3E45C3|nr:2Fe-2S iron-sulfur cluster-binding protein [Methylocaldum sp.]HYE37191.1 2Fe-2S iron-sulfur cluster-binding protein [Methylocaldum sp.]